MIVCDTEAEFKWGNMGVVSCFVGGLHSLSAFVCVVRKSICSS